MTDLEISFRTHRPQDWVLIDTTGFVWMLDSEGRLVPAIEPDMHRAREVLARYLDDGHKLARDGED